MSTLIHIEDGGELRGGIESGGTMVLVCRKCGFSWTIDGQGQPFEITHRGSEGTVLYAQETHPEWFRRRK